MSSRLGYLVCVVLIFSLPCIPSLRLVMSASQPDPVQVTLYSSLSSASLGVPVNFSGTVSGADVASVTYVVIGPDGGTFNASVKTLGSTFSFSYAFGSAGNWTVFCMAGDLSNPLGVSDPVFIAVDSGVPSGFMGVPFVWLGAAILVVTAVSLVYLVYAIRKRSQEESPKAAGGEGTSSRKAGQP